MAASNSRVPYDYVCKYHPENDDWEMTKSQIELYEWLDEICNAGYGDRSDHNYPDSLERVKKDYEDLLPAFAYYLRQKSGQQEPIAGDGIPSLPIPAGTTVSGQQMYKSFWDFMEEGRIRRMDLVAKDFMMIFRKQQTLYKLAVGLVFTGPHSSCTRPFSNPRNGRMILEPGISEAALKRLLDITTNMTTAQTIIYHL